MLLERHALAPLIPHAGTMCLLDGVMTWDAEHITCAATSHRQPLNPLARTGALAAVCGLEYAAQAMAIHGRLTGAVRTRPRQGVIASVRELAWSVTRLDDIADDLVVEATKLAGDGAGVLYRFGLGTAAGGAPLVKGRVTVLLEVGEP